MVSMGLVVLISPSSDQKITAIFKNTNISDQFIIIFLNKKQKITLIQYTYVYTSLYLYKILPFAHKLKKSSNLICIFCRVNEFLIVSFVDDLFFILFKLQKYTYVCSIHVYYVLELIEKIILWEKSRWKNLFWN